MWTMPFSLLWAGLGASGPGVGGHSRAPGADLSESACVMAELRNQGQWPQAALTRFPSAISLTNLETFSGPSGPPLEEQTLWSPGVGWGCCCSARCPFSPGH